MPVKQIKPGKSSKISRKRHQQHSQSTAPQTPVMSGDTVMFEQIYGAEYLLRLLSKPFLHFKNFEGYLMMLALLVRHPLLFFGGGVSILIV
jgi:hypothetical protein